MKPAFAAVMAAMAVALSSCAHRAGPPARWQWGMPVYPNASVHGTSSGKASFVLYRTEDSVEDVYRWYIAQLPAGTPEAFDATRKQATFALIDAHVRRTVHIQSDGGETSIFLTELRP